MPQPISRQLDASMVLRDHRNRIASLATDTGSPWQDVADSVGFLNDWTDTGTGTDPAVGFYIKGGHVRFRGVLAGGVYGTVAYTLPVSYRPDTTVRFVCSHPTADVAVLLRIDPSGDVTPVGEVTAMPIGSSPVGFSPLSLATDAAFGDMAARLDELTGLYRDVLNRVAILERKAGRPPG